MTKSIIRFHTFLRGIILAGYTLFFFKLLVTNQIIYFISPKMKPFLDFTAIVLLILGIFQIIKGTSANQKDVGCSCCEGHHPPGNTLRSFLYYSLFIIPIITGFLFADHTLNSAVAEKRQIQFGTLHAQKINQVKKEDNTASKGDTKEKENSASRSRSINDKSQQQSMTEQEYESLKKTLLSQRKIMMNDDKYIPILDIIEENLPEFAGKEIETAGFVFRENGFSNDQVVIARFGVVCCVADASVYGIMAKGNVAELKNDTWVKIRGTIDSETYNSTTVPSINIKSIEKIAEPAQPYVYDIPIKIE
ncbi:TIGR03943 family putative permease subunit [Bacillus songklensis]|uniref:TIGR03943 family putative permease subunit n=1 Tax=Bacillus songklensis TaxID=1069116 RepID=A0ABV8B9A1_9BACI